MSKIYRVSGAGKFERVYVRANDVIEAGERTKTGFGFTGVVFQEIILKEDHDAYAIYMTDGTGDPLWPLWVQAKRFKDAKEKGELHIRQWDLDAEIEKIVMV